MLQNKCSFARTSYATNMFPFTKRKACCENNTAYIRYGNYWKKDTILNRLLSTSSWKNFTFLKTTWPTKELKYGVKIPRHLRVKIPGKEKGGGGGRRKSTCSRNTKNLEKTKRNKKTSRKPKKTIKPKKTKKTKILDSSGSWGASPRPPDNWFFVFFVFFGFIGFFGFLEVFLVLLVFSSFFWFFSVL